MKKNNKLTTRIKSIVYSDLFMLLIFSVFAIITFYEFDRLSKEIKSSDRKLKILTTIYKHQQDSLYIYKEKLASYKDILDSLDAYHTVDVLPEIKISRDVIIPTKQYNLIPAYEKNDMNLMSVPFADQIYYVNNDTIPFTVVFGPMMATEIPTHFNFYKNENHLRFPHNYKYEEVKQNGVYFKIMKKYPDGSDNFYQNITIKVNFKTTKKTERTYYFTSSGRSNIILSTKINAHKYHIIDTRYQESSIVKLLSKGLNIINLKDLRLEKCVFSCTVIYYDKPITEYYLNAM